MPEGQALLALALLNSCESSSGGQWRIAPHGQLVHAARLNSNPLHAGLFMPTSQMRPMTHGSD